VVLFTSTLDDDWTDFPLRSIYVALVHQFARSLSGTLLLEGGSVVAVGDTLPLPAPPDLELQAWVVGPDGREQSLDRGSADAEGRIPFRGTRVPGHYSLYWETRGPSDEAERGQLKALFSVRVPEDESLLRPADRKALLAAVPGLVHHGAGSSTASDAPGKVVRTASLGPGLLALLALCLVGEAVLAGRQT